jgi:hypothetical protein
VAAEIHCVYKLGGFIWADLKGVSTAVMNEFSLEFVSAFTISMFPFWVVMPSTSAEIERVLQAGWMSAGWLAER